MTTTETARPTGSCNSGPVSRDRLITAAHVVLANCGYPVGQSKVGRLVHRFERGGHGYDFAGFIASSLVASGQRRALVADELRRVVSYSDPTGESAVRHVLRGRR